MAIGAFMQAILNPLGFADDIAKGPQPASLQAHGKAAARIYQAEKKRQARANAERNAAAAEARKAILRKPEEGESPYIWNDDARLEAQKRKAYRENNEKIRQYEKEKRATQAIVGKPGNYAVPDTEVLGRYRGIKAAADNYNRAMDAYHLPFPRIVERPGSLLQRADMANTAPPFQSGYGDMEPAYMNADYVTVPGLTQEQYNHSRSRIRSNTPAYYEPNSRNGSTWRGSGYSSTPSQVLSGDYGHYDREYPSLSNFTGPVTPTTDWEGDAGFDLARPVYRSAPNPFGFGAPDPAKADAIPRALDAMRRRGTGAVSRYYSRVPDNFGAAMRGRP